MQIKNIQKITSEKDFDRLTNNLNNLGKTRENVRKDIYIKLVTNRREKKSFGDRTKLSYNKIISRKHNNSSEKVRKKVKYVTKIKLWKKVRTKLYVFNNWIMYRGGGYECGQKAKLCYMITYIFAAQIKAEDIHVNIVKDAETKFDPSNQELDRP